MISVVRQESMEDPNPYSPTSSQTLDSTSPSVHLIRLRFWCGVAIPVSLVVGILLTVIGIMLAFHRVAETTSINPGQLARDIRNSLAYSAIGILGSTLAIAVRLCASALLRRKEHMPSQRLRNGV